MPGPLGHGDSILPGADLFHLAEGGARHHEGEGEHPLAAVHRLVPKGEPVAVHRHDGQAALVHLEQGAGVDGAALVVAHREQGLGHHRAQHRLADGQPVLLLHRGQFGKFFRVRPQDVEFRQAALDIDHIVLRGEYHHVIRHLPDDLAKQPGGEDQ